MAAAQSDTNSSRRSPARRKRSRRGAAASRINSASASTLLLAIFLLTAGAFAVYWALTLHARYTLSLQSPIKLNLQWPLVVARRMNSEEAHQSQLDQRHPLTAYQQYTCLKFGDACRVALAIQRAENPEGKCDSYHYNSDGTLDWGYFQINTVHLRRSGLNLRDLLDCRANIDFAFQLYAERHTFSAWTGYNNGTYRKFLRQ